MRRTFRTWLLASAITGLALAGGVGAPPARATLDPAQLGTRPGRSQGAAASLAPFSTGLAVPPILWSLTAPGEPQFEGASGVVFSGGLLYVASYSTTSGDSTLAIVNPATQAVVGSVSSPDLDGAASLAVSGSYVYVTGLQNRPELTNANRLTIIDASDPREPTVAGTVQDSDALYGAYGVQVLGNLAYVAAQGCVPPICDDSNDALGNRLVIVDVSEKANPRIIGSVADPTGATDHLDAIAVVGDRAYGTAFDTRTFTVFDVTDPNQPTIIGSLSSPLLAGDNDVVVRGRYAYVIDQSYSNARLVVLDVAEPAHPTIVGSVLDTADLDEGYWLKLVGHDVFVAAANSDAMTVVDVSNPAQPQVVASDSSTSQLGVADGIDVAGTTAYVAAFCTTPNSGCSSPTTGALTALDVSPYTALDLTSGPPADATSSTAEVSFSAPAPGTTFTCSLDGAPPAPCTSPYQNPSPLAAGSHSLSVTASTDPTPATWAWTILPAASPSPEGGSPPSSSGGGGAGGTSNSSAGSPTPAPSTAPKAHPDTVTIASTSAIYSHGAAPIVLACAGPPGTRCQGTLELAVRTVIHVARGGRRHTQVRLQRIASAAYALAAGGRRQLRIVLTASGRGVLAHAGEQRLQVQVTATVAGGKAATRPIALTASAGSR
jgi:hypothetical protein